MPQRINTLAFASTCSSNGSVNAQIPRTCPAVARPLHKRCPPSPPTTLSTRLPTFPPASRRSLPRPSLPRPRVGKRHKSRKHTDKPHIYFSQSDFQKLYLRSNRSSRLNPLHLNHHLQTSTILMMMMMMMETDLRRPGSHP